MRSPFVLLRVTITSLSLMPPTLRQLVHPLNVSRRKRDRIVGCRRRHLRGAADQISEKFREFIPKRFRLSACQIIMIRVINERTDFPYRLSRVYTGMTELRFVALHALGIISS